MLHYNEINSFAIEFINTQHQGLAKLLYINCKHKNNDKKSVLLPVKNKNIFILAVLVSRISRQRKTF